MRAAGAICLASIVACGGNNGGTQDAVHFPDAAPDAGPPVAPCAGRIDFGSPPVLEMNLDRFGETVFADLNHDGISDLITLTSNQPVVVQLGLGGGQYEAPTMYSAASAIRSF